MHFSPQNIDPQFLMNIYQWKKISNLNPSLIFSYRHLSQCSFFFLQTSNNQSPWSIKVSKN
ncbi:hypothetical protein MUK42_33431 [Musa troglodytarum]|uniref:Uncharacterized protein n=1 Tax=Musa troglodytarum TaxID=320322 RepID=A0A9E7KQ77_9LILI|nr:hypothetical protein MUK42_33431 [Musa troglodytarum]